MGGKLPDFKILYAKKQPNTEKIVWLQVGAGWFSKNRDKINLHLDSIPTGRDWDGNLVLAPPSEWDIDIHNKKNRATPTPTSDDQDDDIPF